MLLARASDHVAICEQVRPLTPDISEVILRLQGAESMRFRPGQFVNVQIPRPEGKPILRSYSIASPQHHENRLVICLDTDVSGPGSNYLRNLKVGDQVQLKGPLGIFHLKEASTRPAIIVTHISAVGMCRHLAEAALIESPGRSITLLAEVKHPDHLFYHEELLELAHRHASFHYVLTYTGQAEHWTGPRASLLEETLRRLPPSRDVEIYVCGLAPLVTSVKEACKQAGVPPQRIHGEKWSKAEKVEE
jgi:propane monooxygenase reductase subunit